MDITSFVLSHRDRAFLIGDHGNYRAQLSRQLATLRRRLGIATPKNAKYSMKPITASDVKSNVEYVWPVEGFLFCQLTTGVDLPTSCC